MKNKKLGNCSLIWWSEVTTLTDCFKCCRYINYMGKELQMTKTRRELGKSWGEQCKHIISNKSVEKFEEKLEKHEFWY